jgi:8-oxo-dGTP pyrophosphatase MutT (NUDIX family)
MYKVFIDNKVIVFSRKIKKSSISGDSVIVNVSQSGLVDLVELRKSLPAETTLRVIAKNPEEAVRSWFPGRDFVEAAGGIVKGKNGFLFIERHGMWDIPKGKMDEGETPDETAVREVEEECGISGVKAGKLKAVTFHTYNYYGTPTLKKTYWFEMKYKGSGEPVPQAEESITQAIWLPKARWQLIRDNTYESIRYVMDKFE